MNTKALEKTDIQDLELVSRGKVRDIYDLGENLLIVATDRISAFDYVLSPPIPNKGKVLTYLSAFWFDYLSPFKENHLVTVDIDEMPEDVKKHRDVLAGRSMLVKKAKPLPVEAIVRGYISGSAWKEYKAEGTVCGERMPGGMEESEQFPQPIFTPSTKAEQGMHDENISFEHCGSIIGEEVALEIRTASLELYKVASEHAQKQGIIIADTKFEWGYVGDTLVLIDEAFTPDSSRFWPRDQYEKGKGQPSFDKQFVRDYLTSTGWDKNSEPPALPDDVVEKTSQKYIEAYTLITGKTELE